jgi:fucokinase
MTDMKSQFLNQSYNDNWNEYQYMLTHTKPARWDWFVATASNERQAEAYREQIAYRAKNGWLPSGTKYIVVPDPDGKRIGSGGATLNVLRRLLEESGEADPFTGKRILILHSGGNSQRIPQYSACGKLFSRVPRELPDGRCSTLFDEFVISLSGVPARMSDGVLVMSGDVLLLFNPLQIDLQREGTACLSIKAPAETGSHHGVFLPGPTGHVKSFLHKQTLEQLNRMGAINESGNVDIDTGAIWMGSCVVNELCGLFREKPGIRKQSEIREDLFAQFVNETVRLSFYGDFVYPMTTDSTLDAYLLEPAEGQTGEMLESCRKALWSVLHAHPMHLVRMSPGEFIHFGTTLELRDLMLSVEKVYGFLGWKKTVMGMGTQDTTVINGIVHEGARVAPDVYLEDCVLEGGAHVESGCILSNVRFSGYLPADTVVHLLPVLQEENSSIRYVARIYGVEDNSKGRFPEKATFLGRNLDDLLLQTGATSQDIWREGHERTLWTARLYPVCTTMEEAVKQSLMLVRIVCGNSATDGAAVDEAAVIQTFADETTAWLTSPRMSLQESFESACTASIMQFQQEVEDMARIGQFILATRKQTWFSENVQVLGKGDILVRRLFLLARQAEGAPFSLKYRLYRAISEICRQEGIKLAGLQADVFEDLCFDRINGEILDVSSRSGLWPTVPPCMLMDEVSISLPVRLNWGGGWSDTPPYCIEQGGTVLNAAISLKGVLPVKVTVKRLNRSSIVLESRDLGFLHEFEDISGLMRFDNPSDPFALHKVALFTAGILTYFAKESADGCKKSDKGTTACGLHLITEVDVPKGSGLGTSSILAGAIVKALRRTYGLSEDAQSIFDQVLCMEQLMTSGGGWQDQAGGIIPGIKLIHSKPGVNQKLIVEPLELSEGTRRELDERLVLVYTGQRRLARNLLREIVGKYILGQPDTIRILNDIQHLALLMRYELEKGNVNAFIALINRHWCLSCELDTGTTNTSIDQIIQVCSPLIDGAFIAGAGGGGFLQMFLKKGVRKSELAAVLNEIYQDSGVAVWESGIVWD